MSENGEPRWDLLPHDPAGFFDLAASFGRQELKQRYSELIRRFKPEKYPSEFQQIRAAFEALDASLRYGQEQRMSETSARYRWSTDEPGPPPSEKRNSRTGAPTASEQPVGREPERVVSLAVRLEQEEPRRLYEELEQRKSKSAYDYYALAVLADMVQPPEQLGFLHWILAGLKAIPKEPALSALLYQLLRQSDFGAANAKVLQAISLVFPSDQFYYFTESLWSRLLKGNSAEHFATSLERCEANLRDHRSGAKVTFYVRILRTALWRASDPWIEQTLAFLKENEDQIHGELEYEMEFNLQLDQYRRSAGLFVNGSPEREKIDRCIREFCTLDEREAAERLVRTQLELAADSQALLTAVPFDQVDYSAAYTTLRWIAHETNARLGIEWTPPEYDKVWESTVRFMREFDATDDPGPWRMNGILKGAAEFGALFFITAFVLTVSILIVSVIVDHVLHLSKETANIVYFLTTMSAIIGTVFYCVAHLREKTTNRWFDSRRQRIALHKYQHHWRDQILRFVQKSQYSLEDIHGAITAAVQHNPGFFEASTWLPGFTPHDYGLAFYALAHSYVR